MENLDKHISYNQRNSEHDDFLTKVEIPFAKSKDEIWGIISDKLSDRPHIKSKTKVISMIWFKVSAAAIVILLIGTSLFLKFYTKNFHCNKGEHISQVLPDGSVVEMNAESSISYHPYWWNFDREVTFEGEAFFEVERGKKFKVLSENGITEVLGTGFNIYARNNDYKVYCETGKVKVSSTKTNVDFIISPGEIVIIDNENKLGKVENIKAENILSWKNNKFIFTSELLTEVFEELERQYNVSIITDLENPDDYIYTGYFTKDVSVKSSLNFICKSFNFTFVKLEKNKYKVLQNR